MILLTPSAKSSLYTSFFSGSYNEARTRFLNAASSVDARVSSYRVDTACAEELFVDVAIIGEAAAPTVLTSSGVHGVEGFFGSAVQLALLEGFKNQGVKPDIRHVLIHGINPYGFCQMRRFNEDNVDLNRNFLLEHEAYTGAPPTYAALNGLLNPQTPPSRFELFKLKALWNISRHGLQALKQAVAGGQYEYPQGLFFGGHRPCLSSRIIQRHCTDWFGASESVVHIDFHSGLGAYGEYKLLINEEAESAGVDWYADRFGAECVEPIETSDGTAYKVSGMFGKWMQHRASMRDYRFVGAEFGTYDVIRVLAAIRAENRAYHYGSEDSAQFKAAKLELMECFCPADVSWRNQVIDSALKIVSDGERAMSGLHA